MHFIGPINYRPFLDKTWYANGGVDEIMLAISYSMFTLPAIPTSSAIDNTGAPSYSTLLSRSRFLARAQTAKMQGQALFRHPLMHELHLLWWPERNKRAREAALEWHAGKNDGQPHDNGTVHGPRPFLDIAPCVITNDGSSLGPVRLMSFQSSSFSDGLSYTSPQRDGLVPSEYPQPSSQGAPTPPVRFRLSSSTLDLRCRPGNLYLGSLSIRGRILLTTWVDSNTFDPELALEWMEEVRDAALFYLGDAKREETRLLEAKL